jgi:hypothetical protein
MPQARDPADRPAAAVRLIHPRERHRPVRHVRRLHCPRRVEPGVVPRPEQIQRPVLLAVDQPHLPHPGHATRPAPRREPPVMHRLERDERLLRQILRRVHDDPAVPHRAPELVPDARPAARRVHPEVELDRPRVGEVPLRQLKRPLARRHLPHHLWDHEVEVDVTLPVDVRQLVHRDPTDQHLDVLTVRRVEPTQEDLLPLALGAVLAQQHPRHQPQQVIGRAPPRRDRQLARVDHPLRRRHRRPPRADHRRVARHLLARLHRGLLLVARHRMRARDRRSPEHHGHRRDLSPHPHAAVSYAP